LNPEAEAYELTQTIVEKPEYNAEKDIPKSLRLRW